MVAHGDSVNMELLSKVPVDLFCQPKTAGSIFTVNNDKIGLVLLTNSGKQGFQALPSNLAHHITDG
jgi:hypothetical protein